MENNIKILKRTHKQSMLKWIISNKKMSITRKIYKFWVYQRMKLGKYFRKGNQCNLLFACVEHSHNAYKLLFRRTELLMKKGYIVRLELSLSEKDISNIDSEASEVLIRLIDLLSQQKESIYF